MSGFGTLQTLSGHHDAPRDDAWVFHGEGGGGDFVRAGAAGFNLHDRGVTFGDGVYEVVRYDGGRAFAVERHVERLRRSLAAVEIGGVDPAALAEHSDELLRRNGWTHAKAYWQVTRGRQPRDFVIGQDVRPTVTAWLAPTQPLVAGREVARGSAILAEDVRWLRCDVKSLLLMPASLARTRASRAGAVEAIFVREKADGQKYVTEGTSTNVIAVKDGVLLTAPGGPVRAGRGDAGGAAGVGAGGGARGSGAGDDARGVAGGGRGAGVQHDAGDGHHGGGRGGDRRGGGGAGDAGAARGVRGDGVGRFA